MGDRVEFDVTRKTEVGHRTNNFIVVVFVRILEQDARLVADFVQFGLKIAIEQLRRLAVERERGNVLIIVLIRNARRNSGSAASIKIGPI